MQNYVALSSLKHCTHALTVTDFFLIYGKCFHSVLRGGIQQIKWSKATTSLGSCWLESFSVIVFASDAFFFGNPLDEQSKSALLSCSLWVKLSSRLLFRLCCIADLSLENTGRTNPLGKTTKMNESEISSGWG